MWWETGGRGEGKGSERKVRWGKGKGRGDGGLGEGEREVDGRRMSTSSKTLDQAGTMSAGGPSTGYGANIVCCILI